MAYFKVWLVVIVGLFLALPSLAEAGAWPQTPGATQVIVSYEPGSADRAFDASGHKLPLGTWDQNDLSVFIDHGLTPRLTLTAKINFQDYKTDFTRFSGLASVEIGGRWTLHKGDDFVFAVGASAEGLGKGRRSDFDTTTHQGTDLDFRAYVGKSFKLAGVPAFIDVQAARHLRQYDANQYRVDATLGIKPAKSWMIMAQAFAGQTDKVAGAQATWVHAQVSVVRSFGPQQATSLQLALRQTVSGRNVPVAHTVILSLWRNF